MYATHGSSNPHHYQSNMPVTNILDREPPKTHGNYHHFQFDNSFNVFNPDHQGGSISSQCGSFDVLGPHARLTKQNEKSSFGQGDTNDPCEVLNSYHQAKDTLRNS